MCRVKIIDIFFLIPKNIKSMTVQIIKAKSLYLRSDKSNLL